MRAVQSFKFSINFLLRVKETVTSGAYFHNGGHGAFTVTRTRHLQRKPPTHIHTDSIMTKTHENRSAQRATNANQATRAQHRSHRPEKYPHHIVEDTILRPPRLVMATRRVENLEQRQQQIQRKIANLYRMAQDPQNLAHSHERTITKVANAQRCELTDFHPVILDMDFFCQLTMQ